MFSKTKSESDRLGTWREFRKSFSGSDSDVAQAFANVQTEPRYIDYYTPESWPTVFEIVQEGMFCQSGLTLVLAATLSYLDFIKTPEVRLDVISNHITGTEGLVLNHDSKYYNFLPGKVVDEEFVRENATKFDSHIIAVDKLHG